MYLISPFSAFAKRQSTNAQVNQEELLYILDEAPMQRANAEILAAKDVLVEASNLFVSLYGQTAQARTDYKDFLKVRIDYKNEIEFNFNQISESRLKRFKIGQVTLEEHLSSQYLADQSKAVAQIEAIDKQILLLKANRMQNWTANFNDCLMNFAKINERNRAKCQIFAPFAGTYKFTKSGDAYFEKGDIIAEFTNQSIPNHATAQTIAIEGFIETLYVLDGESVTAGQQILKLDTTEINAKIKLISSIKSQLEQALDDAANEKRNLEVERKAIRLNLYTHARSYKERMMNAVKNAMERGIVSPEMYFYIRNDFLDADLMLKQAEQDSKIDDALNLLSRKILNTQIELAQTRIQALEDRIKNSTCVAKADGRLYLATYKGGYAPAGEPLFYLATAEDDFNG